MSHLDGDGSPLLTRGAIDYLQQSHEFIVNQSRVEVWMQSPPPPPPPKPKHTAASLILCAALPSLPTGHLVKTLRCLGPLVPTHVQRRGRSEAGK